MAIKELKNKLIEMDKAEIIKMISEMYKKILFLEINA